MLITVTLLIAGR